MNLDGYQAEEDSKTVYKGAENRHFLVDFRDDSLTDTLGLLLGRFDPAAANTA
jgi:hypothetical protein